MNENTSTSTAGVPRSTCTHSFKTERRVSIITLQGRIVVSYDGYNKHLDLITNGTKKILQRFSELRWTSDTSQHCSGTPLSVG